MFECYGHRECRFDRNCKKVLSLFTKWKNREKRMAYLHHFSIENWTQLSASSKAKHTFSNCTQCAIVNNELQQTFPGKKLQPSSGLTTTVTELMNVNGQRSSETSVTTNILAELQPLYYEQYGQSFTESLASLPGSHVQITPTRVH